METSSVQGKDEPGHTSANEPACGPEKGLERHVGPAVFVECELCYVWEYDWERTSHTGWRERGEETERERERERGEGGEQLGKQWGRSRFEKSGV